MTFLYWHLEDFEVPFCEENICFKFWVFELKIPRLSWNIQHSEQIFASCNLVGTGLGSDLRNGMVWCCTAIDGLIFLHPKLLYILNTFFYSSTWAIQPLLQWILELNSWNDNEYILRTFVLCWCFLLRRHSSQFLFISTTLLFPST